MYGTIRGGLGRLLSLLRAGTDARALSAEGSAGAIQKRRDARAPTQCVARAPREFRIAAAARAADMFYRFYDRYRVFNDRRRKPFPYRFYCECFDA